MKDHLVQPVCHGKRHLSLNHASHVFQLLQDYELVPEATDTSSVQSSFFFSHPEFNVFLIVKARNKSQ